MFTLSSISSGILSALKAIKCVRERRRWRGELGHAPCEEENTPINSFFHQDARSGGPTNDLTIARHDTSTPHILFPATSHATGRSSSFDISTPRELRQDTSPSRERSIPAAIKPQKSEQSPLRGLERAAAAALRAALALYLLSRPPASPTTRNAAPAIFLKFSESVRSLEFKRVSGALINAPALLHARPANSNYIFELFSANAFDTSGHASAVINDPHSNSILPLCLQFASAPAAAAPSSRHRAVLAPPPSPFKFRISSPHERGTMYLFPKTLRQDNFVSPVQLLME
ncbi:hypothetical protein DFH09DRAFT_1464392 [Mycena vulgaris]|nr:hypothetical protein DFH09DRAFT_1464392 [Mycena vulgaris]